MSLRLALLKTPRTITTINTRTFTALTRKMAEGDAGAPRSGGAAQGDAFTKREQASEDYYIKQQQQEKLKALRQKIADKEADIAKDREEVEKMSSGDKK